MVPQIPFRSDQTFRMINFVRFFVPRTLACIARLKRLPINVFRSRRSVGNKHC